MKKSALLSCVFLITAGTTTALADTPVVSERAAATAASFDTANSVKWKGSVFEVTKNSVIQIPESCPNKSRLTFLENNKTDYINNTFSLTTQFIAAKSPDKKYWIVNTAVQCEAEKSKCISSVDVLMYKPSTKAQVTCMKYRGFTIRKGENGEAIIESDIPAHQDALRALKAFEAFEAFDRVDTSKGKIINMSHSLISTTPNTQTSNSKVFF